MSNYYHEKTKLQPFPYLELCSMESYIKSFLRESLDVYISRVFFSAFLLCENVG